MLKRTRAARTTATRADFSSRLSDLAMNLWWSWNPDAQQLFASLDPKLWDATHGNPVATLRRLSPERWTAVANDSTFATHLARVEKSLREYLVSRTWFSRTQKRKARSALVAYSCAEYAVHESFPQYSGGLGVLAGDHLKSASDLGVPLVGVGLLYRAGFYTQQLNADGSTRVVYPELDFADLPVSDTGKRIAVKIAGRTVRARVWRLVVGRTNVYLLDTDIAGNSPNDQKLTRHLYGGDRKYRIEQEMLLGVGGVLALEALGLAPTVYHLNEGHAAFATLERLRQLIAKGVSLEAAKEAVRGTTVFTTHTPVPAGNDRFSPKLTLQHIGLYTKALGISERELLGLGRENPGDAGEEFCMTVLALKLAARCNGVAALHGDTSRRMWTKTFGVSDPTKVPIGHITNGIHSETWLAPEARPLYDRYLKPRWIGASPTNDPWSRAGSIPPAELWQMRTTLRTRLINFIRGRLVEQLTRRHASIEEIAAAQTVLDPGALTIGFARRFATYKRGNLIFHDPKRLAKLLHDTSRPVQLVFAGKAHPQDLGGQRIAQAIHQFARDPRFAGRVVIVEDYDMEVGRMLTSGCDVWLNNPLRPQEASGTSGMKPPLHGGINCSILDGWWPEAFNRRNGWAIKDKHFADQRKQDRRDAAVLYELLDRQIIPEFYKRGSSGLPLKWIGRMAESMRSVCSQFSTHRMVGEYWQRYYSKAHAASTR